MAKSKFYGWVKQLLTFSIVMSFIFVLPVHAATNKSLDGWAIRQSSNFAGTVFSDLTNNSLRMHIGRLGLTIITRAPKWNALVFNENSKTYVDLPYKKWQKKFSVGSNSRYRDSKGRLALVACKTGKTMNIGKYKAFECWIEKKAEPKKHVAEEKVSQLWIASDIKPPPQIAQIFCSHLGIPIQEGIPLKVNRCNNGKMISALETLSVERRRFSASTFEPLPGYKKVKDEIELVMGESGDEIMDDLLIRK